MIRSYKYRIYPTKTQEETLIHWQESCMDAYNLCIKQRRIAYSKLSIPVWGGVKDGKDIWYRRVDRTKEYLREYMPNKFSQSREITELKNEFYPDVPSDTILVMADRVDKGYIRWYKYLKSRGPNKVGMPKYMQNSYDAGLQFRGSDRGTSMIGRKGRYSYWVLSSARKQLGAIKVRYHRDIPHESNIVQAHVTRDNLGEWYISFVSELPNPVSRDLVNTTGVDLNVKHSGNDQSVAALSDGRVYKSTDNLKINSQRLSILQKMVGRDRRVHENAKSANPDSNRTKKRMSRIAKVHKKVARQRDHNLNYIAKRIVDTSDTIAIEDIKWSALRRKGGSRKRGLNRSMSTASPAKLVSMIMIKAESRPSIVKLVNPKNTTQMCSSCGYIGEKKGLNVRSWICSNCGESHDRDVNAAKNIKNKAIALVTDLDRESNPCSSGGLPGEGHATVSSEHVSENLEVSLTQPASNAGVLKSRIRRSASNRRKSRDSNQLSFFDMIDDADTP